MINEKRLLDTFIGYAMIDSETKNEKAMGEKLVEDLKALGLEVKTDKAGEGFGSNGFNVCAYLPGTISAINVKVGSQVKRGDVLIVMEAMKMENNIMANSDGQVKTIHVTTGQSVSQDDPLIELA